MDKAEMINMIERLDAKKHLRFAIDYEVWEIQLCSTEDPGRIPHRITILAGKDGADCMAQAIELFESGPLKIMPDGGAEMVCGAKYLGFIEITLEDVLRALLAE